MTAHRFMLIAATALLAVATSRLAHSVSDAGSWLLAMGAGIVMYEADVLSGLERASEELRRSAGGELAKDPDATRLNMFRYRAPKMTLQLVTLGCILIALGFAWPQIS
jgi:hypothetical protein